MDRVYNHFLKHRKISTDSRDIKENTIFFALKGDNFDGNKYASEAIEKGASYAIIDNGDYVLDNRSILVEDSLTELQNMAVKFRDSLNIPVIGITGTNGKTTTKELIHSVMKQKYTTFATRGNLNNHIGVPLSILSITEETEIAVIEMGANHIGEIALLCTIAQPTHGLITNIGKAHFEGFGSIEGVIKAKTELYDYLREQSGIAFINRDDSLLTELANGVNSVEYSMNLDKYDRVRIKEQYPSLKLEWIIGDQKIPITTKLFGDYNLTNILASIIVGKYFEVDDDEIVKGIQDYTPENLRSQILEKDTNTIILDAYNANPSSMLLAIQNFTNFDTPNKVLILGDMLELGDQSEEEHIGILNAIEKKAFERIIIIGDIFKASSIKHDFISFNDTDEAIEYLTNNPLSNSTVLLKGSRLIRLESLLDIL